MRRCYKSLLYMIIYNYRKYETGSKSLSLGWGFMYPDQGASTSHEFNFSHFRPLTKCMRCQWSSCHLCTRYFCFQTAVFKCQSLQTKLLLWLIQYWYYMVTIKWIWNNGWIYWTEIIQNVIPLFGSAWDNCFHVNI